VSGERRVVRKGAVSIEIFVRGEGPTVLMHPGFGRSARDYNDMSTRLAKAGFKPIAINPRGINASEGPLVGLTLHDYADDVWMVADELELQKVNLLGHAFGNRVMRTASTDQPNRVASITLFAAGGEVAPPKEINELLLKLVIDSKLTPEERHEDAAKALFAPGHDPSEMADGWHPVAAKAEAEAVRRTDEKAINAGGTAPMLIVQGLDNLMAPPQNAWNLVTSRPNAWLVAIPHCGHAMVPEQPRAIAHAIVSFLAAQSEHNSDFGRLSDRV